VINPKPCTAGPSALNQIMIWMGMYLAPRLYLLVLKVWQLSEQKDITMDKVYAELERCLTSVSVLILFYVCTMGYNNYLFKSERQRFLRDVYKSKTARGSVESSVTASVPQSIKESEFVSHATGSVDISVTASVPPNIKESETASQAAGHPVPAERSKGSSKSSSPAGSQ